MFREHGNQFVPPGLPVPQRPAKSDATPESLRSPASYRGFGMVGAPQQAGQPHGPVQSALQCQPPSRACPTSAQQRRCLGSWEPAATKSTPTRAPKEPAAQTAPTHHQSRHAYQPRRCASHGQSESTHDGSPRHRPAPAHRSSRRDPHRVRITAANQLRPSLRTRQRSRLRPTPRHHLHFRLVRC